eukprot:3811458-Amphidinium_carterae.1
MSALCVVCGCRGGGAERSGPTLEEPPLYPKEKLPSLAPQRADNISQGDIALICSHRQEDVPGSPSFQALSLPQTSPSLFRSFLP